MWLPPTNAWLIYPLLCGLPALAQPAQAQETATTEPRRRPTEPGGRDQPDARSGEAPATRPVEHPHTARSVAGAPRPDRSGGVVVAEPRPPGERLLLVPRVVLFAPRAALAIVNAPVRTALWANDRLEVEARWYDIFFNRDRTIGLLPIVNVDSDYGIGGGGRFLYRDILGANEFFTARASFGGSSSQLYAARLESGERLGKRLEVALEGEYDRRIRDPFHGVGNADEVGAAGAALDPFGGEAVASRFGQTVARGAGIAGVRIAEPLFLFGSGAVVRKTFREPSSRVADDEQISENYAVSELPGWDRGVSYLYGELELRYDSRRPASLYDIAAMPSTGWRLAGFAGVADGFAREPTQYARYGVDLQRYLRIGDHPRVFVLRGYLEGVAGNREEIPFVDLPRLGGPLLLRGYSRDRFRDEVAAVTSVEYQWDLIENVASYLFVDAGRVYPSLGDLAVDDLRVGFGGGLQLHTRDSFVARLNLGSSIDGGFVFNLSLDPVYDPRARVEKK
jgi:hypothetical protein